MAGIIYDLVHFGGYTRADARLMPLFERDFIHGKVADSVKNEQRFQMALHDKKPA